jgi:hypothetical protein
MISEGEVVESYASGVVLAVYNWAENTERYNKVARFVEKFFNKFENFHKPPRHPKWKTVNLAANIPGWTRFKPAQQWLDNAEKNRSPRSAAFSAFLKESGAELNGRPLTKEEEEVLFKKFTQWWASKQQ